MSHAQQGFPPYGPHGAGGLPPQPDGWPGAQQPVIIVDPFPMTVAQPMQVVGIMGVPVTDHQPMPVHPGIWCGPQRCWGLQAIGECLPQCLPLQAIGECWTNSCRPRQQRSRNHGRSGNMGRRTESAPVQTSQPIPDAAPVRRPAPEVASRRQPVQGERPFVDLAFAGFNESKNCQAKLKSGNAEERIRLAKQFENRIVAAVKHSHANFVVQEMINLIPPTSLMFVVREMENNVRGIAEHNIGCRSLQRILEHFPHESVACIFDEILGDAASAQGVCMNQHGNFVMKHILEYGTPEKKQALCEVLAQDPLRVAKDKYGSHVVKIALRTENADADDKLALALLHNEDTFTRLACSEHGKFPAYALLELRPGGDAATKLHELFPKVQEALNGDQHGRKVAAEYAKKHRSAHAEDPSKCARGN